MYPNLFSCVYYTFSDLQFTIYVYVYRRIFDVFISAIIHYMHTKYLENTLYMTESILGLCFYLPLTYYLYFVMFPFLKTKCKCFTGSLYVGYTDSMDRWKSLGRRSGRYRVCKRRNTSSWIPLGNQISNYN